MADQETWTDDPVVGSNPAPAASQAAPAPVAETWHDDPIADPKTGQTVTPLSEVTVTGHRLNTPYKGEDLSAGAVAQGALQHALPSAWNAIKGIGEGLWNATPGAYFTGTPLLSKDAQGHTTVNLPPTQSALINLGTGLAQQGTNAVLGQNAPQFADPSTARAVEKTYGDRYGTWDNIKSSVKNDPASVALDLASVLDPVVKLGGVALDTARASRIAAGAASTADAAQAAKATDIGSQALKAGVQKAPHTFDSSGKLVLDSDIKNGPGTVIDQINAQGARNTSALKPVDAAQISPQDLDPAVVKQHIAQGGDLDDFEGMSKRQATQNAADNKAKGFKQFPPEPEVAPSAAPAAPKGGALSQQFQAGRSGSPFDSSIVPDSSKTPISPWIKRGVDVAVGATLDPLMSKLGPLRWAGDVGVGMLTDKAQSLLASPGSQARMAYGAGTGLRYGQGALGAAGKGVVAGALGATHLGAAGNVANNVDYGQRNAKTYDTDMSLREYKALNKNRYVSDDAEYGADKPR